MLLSVNPRLITSLLPSLSAILWRLSCLFALKFPHCNWRSYSSAGTADHLLLFARAKTCNIVPQAASFRSVETDLLTDRPTDRPCLILTYLVLSPMVLIKRNASSKNKSDNYAIMPFLGCKDYFQSNGN